jgi:hypothetical protein
MKSIVAFMQNPWFHEGTKEQHIISYRDNQGYHQLLLKNTMSGARLKQAFGDLFESIWWDNANWRPDWMIVGKLMPDYTHMHAVIQAHDPAIIITFGRMATEATAFLPMAFRTHYPCHHPNARHRTQEDLNQFASMVKQESL